MKKSLLTILSLATIGSAVAQQTPSPSWTITQNASFSVTSAGIKFLDAVDANTVWAIGTDGTAPARNYNWWSKTTNGGTSYTSGNCYADTNTYVLANLEGIDGNTAWVSSYLKASQDRGGVHKTTDGGANWVNMLTAPMFSVAGGSFVNLVSFLTPSIGIVQGDPITIGGSLEFEIYKTTDGGANWAAIPGANIPNPLGGEFGLVNIYTKQGTSNYWFGTNKNRIFRSTDAGQTWSVAAQMTSTMGAVLGVNDIAFTDANNGVAAVYFGPTGQGTLSLWNTTNGGATWSVIPSVDPNFGKNDMCNIAGTSWFASAGAGAGNNIVSFSSDNGVTWNSWGGANIQYLYIDFVNPSTGWVGSFSSNTLASQGGIYKYSGASLLQPASASFTIAATNCTNVGVPVTNNSGGNPFPTYSWSVSPNATISNSTATNPLFTFTVSGTYTITLSATNPSNTSVTTRTISIANCVGMNENTMLSQNISIYPNPANDKMNIDVNGLTSFNYVVTDLLGKVIVSDKSVSGERTTIDVSTITKGIYFLTIENNGQKATKKIIVE